jgi:NAD-dependent dihydropyrimidine dehydrogenase PreA subunit
VTVILMAKTKKRPKKRSASIAIVRENDCTGCEVCIVFCPVDCIDLKKPTDNPAERYVLIDKETCIGCTLCARYCPWESIDMVERKAYEESAELVFI